MKMNITRALPLLVASLFLLGGCPMMFGPPQGWDDHWTHCDGWRCYDCTLDGCAVPNTTCPKNGNPSACPGGSTCDPNGQVCRGSSCKVTGDCESGFICSQGTCVPKHGACASCGECGSGAYCKNGNCQNSKGCGSDQDCKALGNFQCDPSGTCVPGTPSPTAYCSVASQCPGGMCVDGKCGNCLGDCGGGKTCQFDAHCGPGRACLDGQCTNRCTTNTSCATSQVCKQGVCFQKAPVTCKFNKDCPAANLCVNSQCVPDCTASLKCSNVNDICTAKVTLDSKVIRACHPNHQPKLQCTVTKDCTGGKTCVNGICRTSCASNNDCAACDNGKTCGKGGYCMTAAEAAPMCDENSDCAANEACLNARCIVK